MPATITLDNTGYVDAAGNRAAAPPTPTTTPSTPAPDATIVVADTALAVGETRTVTITFSEAVTGLIRRLRVSLDAEPPSQRWRHHLDGDPDADSQRHPPAT
jgi:hypothetical protein